MALTIHMWSLKALDTHYIYHAIYTVLSNKKVSVHMLALFVMLKTKLIYHQIGASVTKKMVFQTLQPPVSHSTLLSVPHAPYGGLSKNPAETGL